MIEVCCAGLQMVEHKAQWLALAWAFTYRCSKHHFPASAVPDLTEAKFLRKASAHAFFTPLAGDCHAPALLLPPS